MTSSGDQKAQFEMSVVSVVKMKWNYINLHVKKKLFHGVVTCFAATFSCYAFCTSIKIVMAENMMSSVYKIWIHWLTKCVGSRTGRLLVVLTLLCHLNLLRHETLSFHRYSTSCLSWVIIHFLAPSCSPCKSTQFNIFHLSCVLPQSNPNHHN